jgi:hypothetical protein
VVGKRTVYHIETALEALPVDAYQACCAARTGGGRFDDKTAFVHGTKSMIFQIQRWQYGDAMQVMNGLEHLQAKRLALQYFCIFGAIGNMKGYVLAYSLKKLFFGMKNVVRVSVSEQPFSVFHALLP